MMVTEKNSYKISCIIPEVLTAVNESSMIMAWVTTLEHKGKGYYHDHPLTICWCQGWLTLTGSSRYLSMASFLTPSQRAFRGCVLSMLLFILIRNRHVSCNTFTPQKLHIPSRKNTTSVLGCMYRPDQGLYKTVNKTLSIHRHTSSNIAMHKKRSTTWSSWLYIDNLCCKCFR